MIPASFIWALFLMIAVGVPIVFALGIAPMGAFILAGKEPFLKIIAQRLYTGINQTVNFIKLASLRLSFTSK